MQAKFISEIIFDNSLPQSSYLCALPVIKHLAKNERLPFSSERRSSRDYGTERNGKIDVA